jgi:type II secretory pathway component GspD/PulD (secretin)
MGKALEVLSLACKANWSISDGKKLTVKKNETIVKEAFKKLKSGKSLDRWEATRMIRQLWQALYQFDSGIEGEAARRMINEAKVTLSFTNSDLAVIINQFAFLSRVSFIYSPEKDNPRVSLIIEDESLFEALTILFSQTKYIPFVKNGILMITPYSDVERIVLSKSDVGDKSDVQGKITLKMMDAPVKSVLEQIGKQMKIEVRMEKTVKAKEISLSIGNISATDVLNDLAILLGCKWKKEKDVIVFYKD